MISWCNSDLGPNRHIIERSYIDSVCNRLALSTWSGETGTTHQLAAASIVPDNPYWTECLTVPLFRG
jgi:hypothetical protein